jgi:hypothetical protein
MRVLSLFSLLILAVFLGLSAAPSEPPARDPSQPRLLAAPDILVSRDGDTPHVELMLAANPLRPSNLVGAAITATGPGGETATTSYASFDGGFTWKATGFPDSRAAGGGDPQTIFTQAGTALHAALVSVQREGRSPLALHVYRSENGGASWSRPADLGLSYDHDQIAVDRTTGPHAGRIYLGALWDYPVYRVGVFHSDDDGRSWAGPVESANGGGELGVNVCPLLVLSDGTLFVPYTDFEFKPEHQWGERTAHMWAVLSTDGGSTFSRPWPIATVRYPETFPSRFHTFPTFAADTRGRAFRDRIYGAWDVARDGAPGIVLAWSTDRGKTWSAPVALPRAAAGAQFQPAIAVNDQGVLACSWYETALAGAGESCSGSRPCFDEYFTASLDGGVTFLPPARLSSQRSRPGWHLSSDDRYGNGGDYMGLTSDATGAFHPFWADARSGTFQIYTAVVRVLAPSAWPTPPGRLVRRALRSAVELVHDPTRYDADRGILEMPVRLKNVSRRPVYAPIVLEVVELGAGAGARRANPPPEVLNATNGQRGAGATFDYTPALGDLGMIAPGAQSAALVWKLKVDETGPAPVVRTAVTGLVEPR